MSRLPHGGRIDRDRPLDFSFNGRLMTGYAGDTLAAALLANDVVRVARSFKYGRPRGIVGHGVEEPNAIVQLGTGAASLPNQRATEVELVPGLSASTPPARLQRALGVFGRYLPAGFYYKFFMHPPRLWRAWERMLRFAAGLGEAPPGPDPDIYDKFHRHCDILVVGAGPAGLAAALAGGRTGARVLITDEQAEFGGSLLAETLEIDGGSAAAWVAGAVAELEALPDVSLLPRSTVSGYYDHNFLTVLERRSDHVEASGPAGARSSRQRLHHVRAGHVVLATGAIERPLVFANNDLPGVMLASSVATYLNRYAVTPGERLVGLHDERPRLSHRARLAARRSRRGGSGRRAARSRRPPGAGRARRRHRGDSRSRRHRGLRRPSRTGRAHRSVGRRRRGGDRAVQAAGL